MRYQTVLVKRYYIEYHFTADKEDPLGGYTSSHQEFTDTLEKKVKLDLNIPMNWKKHGSTGRLYDALFEFSITIIKESSRYN